MLDFQNSEFAFAAKSDSDLKKAKFLFSFMQHPQCVKLGKGLYNTAHTLRIPTSWAIRPTIYAHFVAGETLESSKESIDLLYKYNVQSVLDYSAEGSKDEAGIQAIFDETIRIIENAAQYKDRIPYAVFKPTALAVDGILEKKSLNKPFTETEAQQYKNYEERMDALAKRSYDLGVRLLVDAEHYAEQKAIDDLVNDLMERYNKERAIVFNTLQMYRHDRYDHLVSMYEKAVEKGFHYGAKLVRGAYMEEERARAQRMGYPDPICRDKAATDENYNKGVRFCVEHIDRIELFSGTHNEESVRNLVNLMKENKLEPDCDKIFFAQLYGMSDNLSFNLAKAKYNASKYLPYGPIEKVMPYLIRRAEENTSIAGQTNRELALIEQEMKRRKKS